MFNLFEKKVKPYNKEKDISEDGYRKCLLHLANSANIEFLLESKKHSLIILSPLDFIDHKLGVDCPSLKFKAMIESMSDKEYQSWLSEEVFH